MHAKYGEREIRLKFNFLLFTKLLNHEGANKEFWLIFFILILESGDFFLSFHLGQLQSSSIGRSGLVFVISSLPVKNKTMV